nr:immunoglobulin heavy chain junction region [Macaca mulatta]
CATHPAPHTMTILLVEIRPEGYGFGFW